MLRGNCAEGGLGVLGAGPDRKVSLEYLRHDDYTEIQPVPGIPEEGEGSNAESSGQNFDQRFESVNASESVPDQMGWREGERD